MTQKKKNLMGRHSLSCNLAGSWLIFGFLKNAVQPVLRSIYDHSLMTDKPMDQWSDQQTDGPTRVITCNPK